MYRNRTIGLILAALMLPVLNAKAQEEVSITAGAPRVVRVGEQFRLNFTVNAEPQSFNAPGMEDFYVLSGPNQSTSHSFRIINGRRTSSTTITYTYYLQATGEGEYTIPPAMVTVDGREYRSNPVSIEVIAGDREAAQPAESGQGSEEQSTDIDVGEELFVRLHTDRSSIYQGEHIIVTIKLYTRLQITRFGESDMPDFDGFWTQEIQAPTQLTLIREDVNGRIFNTGMIRKVILFPQKTGQITISPFSLETYIRQQVRRPQSPQSLFDDFFGSTYTEVQKLLMSEPVTIEVKPLPAGAPADFSGTVGKVGLQAEVDRRELETNDALTYRIIISGTGNIQLAEAPDVNFPPDFESYDPKVQTNVDNTDGGQSGRKTFEYLLIPRHAGNYRIPPVSLSYFDPASKQYKTLSTSEFNLVVSKGEESETVSVITGRTKEDLRIIGSDILFIKDDAFRLRKIGGGLFGSLLFFLLYGVSLFLFLTVLLIRRNRIRKLRNVELMRNQRASKEARKRLRAAAGHMRHGLEEDFYEAVLKALEGYMSDKLSIPLSQLGKERVRTELAGYGMDEALVEEYLDLEDSCEIAKYAPGSVQGGMEDLYKRTIGVISRMDQNLRK